MYINPFLAGVLATIAVEVIVVMAACINLALQNGKEKKDNEKT